MNHFVDMVYSILKLYKKKSNRDISIMVTKSSSLQKPCYYSRLAVYKNLVHLNPFIIIVHTLYQTLSCRLAS